jgi:hypothetical protein
VTERVNGNEIVASVLTVVAPCNGLAKYFDPETASIHAFEMARLGPGPFTDKLMVPMAAAWVPEALVAADGEAVSSIPEKLWTDALGGVMVMRLPKARGQSTAVLSTEALRARPLV